MKRRYVYHYSALISRDGKNLSCGIIDVDKKIDSQKRFGAVLESLAKRINRVRKLSLTEEDIFICSLTFLHEVKR